MSRCELCTKGFKSDAALLQHYTDKHPEVDPPANVARREALRKGELWKKNANRRTRRRNPLVPAAIAIVIVVIVGFALYSAFGPHSSNLAVAPTDSGTISGIGIGDKAPDIPVTLLNGTQVRLSGFNGHTLLLWFVATWCSSCQIGAQMLASQYYSQLHSKGVIILIVELYDDLGQPGPSISQFADQYGGGSGRPGWFYGTSTQTATYTYDPQADLDIYYLLNSQGFITDTNVGLPNWLGKVSNEVGLQTLTVPTNTPSTLSDVPYFCDNPAGGCAYHWHVHVDIFVNGVPLTIPGDLGHVGNTLYAIHAHDTTGIIHLETPVNQAFKLGQFFEVWGYPNFDSNDALVYHNQPVTIYVNGEAWTGNVANVPLEQHEEVAIVIGTPPGNIPSTYQFLQGL